MAIEPIYLSRDELLDIHDEMIRRHGGMPGVRDEGALDSCLAQPKTLVFDVERFGTLIEKAAAYCFFVARNHPFFDGNKRTGFMAAEVFLRVNHVDTRFDEEQTYELMIQVAEGQLDLEDIASVLAGAVERAKLSSPNNALDW